MKSKRNVSLAVMIIAMCLITTATHAQRSGGPLVLRFRVPFPFTVENTTFAAGEYEVTEPGRFTLALRNVENQAFAFEHVQPAGSSNKADGRARIVFHRYGAAYFLATISDGSWQSNYDFDRSNKEKELIVKNRMRQPEVVSALSNGTVVSADIGRE
jgi:hypothetical protein